jgi:uncharacterized protein YacL
MLNALRALFICCAAVVGWFLGSKFGDHALRGSFAGALAAGLLVTLEISFARRFIATTAVMVIAILFGFIVAYFVLGALYLIPAFKMTVQENQELFFYVDFSVMFFFCFISVIAIMHTKDEFKFVIPFVEFSRGPKSGRALILDTSAIIDGRVVDLLETRILDAEIVIPRFVLNELHQLSDSQDRLKRQRGRRGLDILNRLREDRRFNVTAPDVMLPQIEGVDNKLISLAKTMDARILTSDFNLEKVAGVQDIDVVNLNQLTKALRSPVMTGDAVTIEIVKEGENPGQGVGYLEDGTMVVGEGCADKVGDAVDLVVKNIIQTTAGRIVFGDPDTSKPTSRH